MPVSGSHGCVTEQNTIKTPEDFLGGFDCSTEAVS